MIGVAAGGEAAFCVSWVAGRRWKGLVDTGG
jgi:hypothetical protein